MAKKSAVGRSKSRASGEEKRGSSRSFEGNGQGSGLSGRSVSRRVCNWPRCRGIPLRAFAVALRVDRETARQLPQIQDVACFIAWLASRGEIPGMKSGW